MNTQEQSNEVAKGGQPESEGKSLWESKIQRLKLENIRLKKDELLTKELADALEENRKYKDNIKDNRLRIKEAGGVTGFNFKVLKSKYGVFVIIMLFVIIFALTRGC